MKPSLTVLEDDLIGRILAEAKRILSEIGVEVRGPALRQRLLDYDLKMSGDRILFPPDVVDTAVASTPHSFTLYDRDGNPHAELGGDAVHFVPGSSGLSVLDHRTGKTRLANTADFVDYIRLADGLEHIAYLRRLFPPMMTLNRRCLMCGDFISA
jgi:trimethylamine---corrinoid protein Co-methyltransferase